MQILINELVYGRDFSPRTIKQSICTTSKGIGSVSIRKIMCNTNRETYIILREISNQKNHGEERKSTIICKG